ncbi:MAG: glycosyltransferase family 39 protein [Myxococcales bacterium]|nr:glycosyltransferase family 39 protein [Myxococcota bacterium]MDW8282614.1 glycosyltransferase family 39 protein [Myxococcales bacterium]
MGWTAAARPGPGQDRGLLLLGLALVLCLLVSAVCITAAPLLFHADATHYLSLGANLSRGLGYRSNQLVFPDLMQPPLYPVLIALLIPLAGSPLSAAITVCILCQLLTVVALWLCHGLLWGDRDRWISAILGAVSPNIAFGGALLLEPLFVCTLSLSLYAMLRALRSVSMGWALVAGLGLGLSLLSRPEVVVTGAVLVLLCLLWPTRPRRRLALAGAVLGGGLLCAIPYGLWMRSQLGFFEVLPKIRYNVPFADINAHMAWEPDEARLGTREQRTFFTLMPDRRDFVMNYAFAHPDFDPRPHFPRTREASRQAQWRAVLWSSRAALWDAIVSVGLLHPLTLILIVFGLRRGWRGEAMGFEGEFSLRKQKLLVACLTLLTALNLGPAMVSGIDYFARYLAASALLSIPLAAGGVHPLAQATTRLRLGRLGVPLWAGLAAVWHLAGTIHAARAQVSRPEVRERMVAMERLCQKRLPEGARLLAEHPRYAFLRGGYAFQLPYSRSLSELLDYIRIHHIEYALLDSAVLARNPSRVNRALVDPRAWPPGWTVLEEASPGGKPMWLIRLF